MMIVFDKPVVNGYPNDQELALKYLIPGYTYTLEKRVIGSWHTDVYLKEAPGIAFNSVLFSDPNRKAISVQDLSDEDLQALIDAVHPFNKLEVSEANAGHGMSEYVIRCGHDKFFADEVLKHIQTPKDEDVVVGEYSGWSFAMHNPDLNRLEFQTVDATVIHDRINEWFDIIRNLDGEVVGFALWNPLDYAKKLDADNKKSSD